MSTIYFHPSEPPRSSFGGRPATLVTRMLRPPKVLPAGGTLSAADCSSMIVVWTNDAVPPAAFTSATACSPPASLTSATTTAAPPEARASTQARPMPDEPPRTSATRPVSFMGLLSGQGWVSGRAGARYVDLDGLDAAGRSPGGEPRERGVVHDEVERAHLRPSERRRYGPTVADGDEMG